jgi:hypothetical protein
MGVARVNCVRCGTVVANTPPNSQPLRILVTMREMGGPWVEDLGWFYLEDFRTQPNANGSFSASARFKNWSDNRTREGRIQIWYE